MTLLVFGTKLLVDFQLPENYVYEKLELLVKQQLTSNSAISHTIALVPSSLTMRDDLFNPFNDESETIDYVTAEKV